MGGLEGLVGDGSNGKTGPWNARQMRQAGRQSSCFNGSQPSTITSFDGTHLARKRILDVPSFGLDRVALGPGAQLDTAGRGVHSEVSGDIPQNAGNRNCHLVCGWA